MFKAKDMSQRRSVLTPAQLALLKKRLQGEGGDIARSQVIVRRSGTDPVPLSFAQERLWFLDQLVPGDTTYNCMDTLQLDFPVNVPVLERSLNELVRRHESLRTTFQAVDGEPWQVIASSLQLPLPVVDLRNLPAAQRQAEALRLATEEARQPFDLAAGPLVRATLLRTEEDGGKGTQQRQPPCPQLGRLVHDAPPSSASVFGLPIPNRMPWGASG